MGIEIERKFLVDGDDWRNEVHRSILIEQGYMRSPDATIRVRLKDGAGVLTFKTSTVGVTRGEWQWPIPADEARELMEAFCGDRVMEKTRHYVDVGGHEWSIDEFHGRFDGLLLAEIELDDEEEEFELPGWAGEEVSDDPRYFNEVLANEGLPS
jgi:adenylate cyclase